MKLIIVCSLLMLILGGCLTPSPITRVSINGQTVKVELAQSQAERLQGLSYRNHLDTDHGMLFVFPNYAVRSFWMNEMRFPLDIIWIKDNQVVGIEPSISTTTPLIPYHSPIAVNYVLEVNAGWTKTFSVISGTRVEFK